MTVTRPKPDHSPVAYKLDDIRTVAEIIEVLAICDQDCNFECFAFLGRAAFDMAGEALKLMGEVPG